MLISKGNFLKDNKIAQAHQKIWKIYKCLLTPNCTWSHVLLVNNLHEKHIWENQDGKSFGGMLAICTLHSSYNFPLILQLRIHLTTFHSSYNFAFILQLSTLVTWKMHSLSANQTHVIFSCILFSAYLDASTHLIDPTTKVNSNDVFKIQK